ncbi:hypothetical protein [Komagataeibacter sp. FNDCR2]|uniref:hypothetical protein n=1 Tax=Komagataeibacter sp. FNDCR2 TaxID=2878682 RepID=UPI001E409EE4|nr:hypothetical protein [Komagataeibacter sp. FNDCR2]MCE2576016.1 hypothetical protein [Komagataeibacter sp. FNDCR2]MCE2576863.1 hypothetical protein [Komagataeibacter sp. FNDCR2]
MSDTSGVPSAGSMVALTAAQWATRQPTGQGVQNGAVVAYTPVVTAVPLKMQAATAQTWINQQIATSFAMGTPFTADMKAYVLAINAIANGTDTASTTLPARPTDVMTTATA